MKTPIIYDKTDGQQLRINMISPWLKRYFSNYDSDNCFCSSPDDENSSRDRRTLKVVKLSLDGGFTCPNRDGTKGRGGCSFCSESGSGDMASSVSDKMHKAAGETGTGESDRESIRTAMRSQMKLLSDKWPEEKYNLKYMAYFQNHTNTYGSIEKMRCLFETALEQEGVLGIAIATRSDCISEEVLNLLEELNRRTFLWVELGLQTIHDRTAKAMNMCHTLADYDRAVYALAQRNIRVVTHLILGLPGETREMMQDSVRYVCQDIGGVSGRKIFGIKLHMLNIVKGSAMAEEYAGYVPFERIEEYVELVTEIIEMIPPEITVHRISGDAPRATLVAPDWSYRKRTILNAIHARMKEKNMWQGRLV